MTQDAVHRGSAEHSRRTCVDRPSRSPDEHFRTQGSGHRAYCCTNKDVLVRVPNLHRDK